MKKTAITVLICVVMMVGRIVPAYAAFTEGQKSILRVLALSLTMEPDPLYEEGYLDEELNAMVFTCRNDAGDVIRQKPETAKEFADICARTMCVYLMDYVKKYDIDVDIIVRHIDKNGDFLFCLKNGVMLKTDPIIKAEAQEDEADDDKIRGALIRLYATVSEMNFEGEGELELKCEYQAETDELLITYKMIKIGETDAKRIKVVEKEKMEDGIIEIYEMHKRELEKGDVYSANIRVRFTTNDGITIAETYNGKIIK